jgi:hypothetical protein
MVKSLLLKRWFRQFKPTTMSKSIFDIAKACLRGDVLARLGTCLQTLHYFTLCSPRRPLAFLVVCGTWDLYDLLIDSVSSC